MSQTIEKSSKIVLDDFQKQSIDHLNNQKSLLVCAPTGSGKTLIAKEAIKLALANGQRVFYTAPLKALINQKYHEFCEEFGEDKVGILTGDTSKNRDNSIIVMTTEIYRNMLYGTTFGSIDPFLKDLKFIIFDEFHYINDPSRGTVWEESVIYTPDSVQIVALSATINNPEEIIEWINDIQKIKCELVQSEKRPVPLYHYYFKDNQVNPLLTPNGKLNPKLKERLDNQFAKKSKFKNRSRGKEERNSAPELVSELGKRDMLPAIFFVFSRKGCDAEANNCAKLELLTKEESKQLKSEIELAIHENPHIKKYNGLDLLYRGVAAHHAGMLPRLKTLIEELFTKGLIKVVFSTETLAAGINMPARTTIISNISKASDSGFRTLRASEFLQMAGRAGRRGLDDVGNVVVVRNNNHGAAEVARLATSKPEDIESHFKSSYEMVLNLLINHEYKEVKVLIQKSFGQSLVNKSTKSQEAEIVKLEDQMEDLAAPLCPGELGDLNAYNDMQNTLDETRKKKKQAEKAMDPCVEEYEAAIEMLTMEAKSYPCNGCPKQKPCSKQMDKIKRYRKQARKIENQVKWVRETYWKDFEKVSDLLLDQKYLDENHKPTKEGETCASLRSENSYFIVEAIKSGIFNDFEPAEFAGAVSPIILGEIRSRNITGTSQSEASYKVMRELNTIVRRVIQTQRKFSVDKHAELNFNYTQIIEDWAKGTDWDELVSPLNIDDGDVLKAIRRTLDICRQISSAPNVEPKLKSLAESAATLLERDIIVENV